VTSITADWNINEGTLFINTTASGGLGTNNTLVMNGGNLLLSKGVGSNGTYSGGGQDTPISVLADTIITLDPNENAASGANTASFPSLSVGTKTIQVRKGANTKSSATDSNYADPQLSFKSATLTGQVTFDVATNVETVLQAASGTGGVTKTGDGKLTLSASTTLGANSYTGATIVNAGALALRGSNSSSVTVGSAGVLDLALTTSNVPTTTGALVLSNGAKIRPTGTPTQASYALLSAAGGITGTPVLESAISGYELAVSGNNLLLQQQVVKSTPSVTWTTPAAITYGTALSATQLNATSLVAGSFTYSPTNGAVLNAGTRTLTAVFTADDTNNYVSPVTNTVILVVNKATPTVTTQPAASTINQGQSLASSVFTGGAASVAGSSVAGSFAWTDSSITPAVGTSLQGVTFTPGDTNNYSTATTSVSVTVTPAGPTFESAYGGINMTNIAPNGLTYLVNYAFGGSSNSTAKLPVQDTSDPTKLKLVAFVRTNDVSGVPITVKGQTGSSLTSWDPNLIEGQDAENNDGAPAGTRKRIFSVDVSGDRQFLRLKVTK